MPTPGLLRYDKICVAIEISLEYDGTARMREMMDFPKRLNIVDKGCMKRSQGEEGGEVAILHAKILMKKATVESSCRDLMYYCCDSLARQLLLSVWLFHWRAIWPGEIA